MQISYPALSSQIARNDARIVSLSSASFCLLHTALSAIGMYHHWHNDTEELTSSEWDTVDNWIATAYKELLQEHECEVTLPEYGILQEIKATGVDAGASVVGWQDRSLLNIVVDRNLLWNTTGGGFTLAAGVYYATAWATAFKTDEGKIRLYDSTASSALLTGAAGYSAVGSGVNALLTLEGEITIVANNVIKLQQYANYAHVRGLGRSAGDGSSERYAGVTLERMS